MIASIFVLGFFCLVEEAAWLEAVEELELTFSLLLDSLVRYEDLRFKKFDLFIYKIYRKIYRLFI